MDYIQWSALWQASKGFGVGFGQGLVFSKMALNLQLATQEETFPNLPRMLVKLSLKHCMREDVPRMFRIRKNDTAAPKLYKQVPILYLLRAEGVNDGISIACAILEWTELIWSEGKSEDNASLCARFNVKLPSNETCLELPSLHSLCKFGSKPHRVPVWEEKSYADAKKKPCCSSRVR